MFATDDDFKRADWPLLQHGAVTLFWRRQIFDETRTAIRALGYDDISIDYQDYDSFRLQLSAGLRWGDQFGYEPWTGNLDALNDAFSTYPFGASGCAAVCLTNFDALVRDDEFSANALLDIIEGSARRHLLHSQRLLALVQTNDARYAPPAVGSRPVMWNQREWFDASRG